MNHPDTYAIKLKQLINLPKHQETDGEEMKFYYQIN